MSDDILPRPAHFSPDLAVTRRLPSSVLGGLSRDVQQAAIRLSYYLSRGLEQEATILPRQRPQFVCKAALAVEHVE